MQLRDYVAAADVDARLDSHQREGGRGDGGGEENSTEESARLGAVLVSVVAGFVGVTNL